MERDRGFWKRAQVEMARRHLSMADLGRLSRVSEQAIAKGISTKGVPRADNAMRIADALEVPLRQLLEGDKRPEEVGDLRTEKERNTMDVLRALPLLSEKQEELLLKILKVWKVVK